MWKDVEPDDQHWQKNRLQELSKSLVDVCKVLNRKMESGIELHHDPLWPLALFQNTEPFIIVF